MGGRCIFALPRVFLVLCAVSVALLFIQALYIAVDRAKRFPGGCNQVNTELHLVLSQETMIAEVEKSIPSLPLGRVIANRGQGLALNSSCAPFPDVYDLQLTNTHWQTTNLGNSTVQLFGAYFDNRTGEPVLRLLAMVDIHPLDVQGHCQVWFDDEGPPAVVPLSVVEYLWHWYDFAKGVYHPYLMTCRVPPERTGGPPSMVSLVDDVCDTASYILKVHDDHPAEKKDFAVCVRGLQLLEGDYAVRLVEWLELVRILGAIKVFIYQLHIHPTIDQVLRYYEEAGLVSVSHVTPSGRILNHPLLQDFFVNDYRVDVPLDEIIHYNDCIYRNLNSYRYLALMDIDEVIIPTHNQTWRELVDAVLPKATAAFNQTPDTLCAFNVYFFDDFPSSGEQFRGVPRGAHILRHVRRSRLFSPKGFATKCFHDTGKVLASHNHYPLECLRSPCQDYEMEQEDARMQHYRRDCREGAQTSCVDYLNDTVDDTTVWRYRDHLVKMMTLALREIGLSDDALAD